MFFLPDALVPFLLLRFGDDGFDRSDDCGVAERAELDDVVRADFGVADREDAFGVAVRDEDFFRVAERAVFGVADLDDDFGDFR